MNLPKTIYINTDISYSGELNKSVIGMVIRSNKETDVIKQFIEYAVKQGSKSYKKNPSLAYSNITKMENKSLFILENKVKNLRDILNCKQLDEIKQADEIVEKALTSLSRIPPSSKVVG